MWAYDQNRNSFTRNKEAFENYNFHLLMLSCFISVTADGQVGTNKAKQEFGSKSQQDKPASPLMSISLQTSP